MLVENFLDDDEQEDEVDSDWDEKEPAPALSGNGRLTLIIAVLALIFSLASLMVGVQNLSTTHETQTVSNSSVRPFRKVVFTPDKNDPLEGDCTQNGRNMHVRLVSLETLGDKAILTTKVTNNSKQDDFVGFPIMVFQNGYQTSAGDIGNSRLKAGQSEKIQTTVNIEDPSKPIVLDVNLYSQKLQVSFNPMKE